MITGPGAVGSSPGAYLPTQYDTPDNAGASTDTYLTPDLVHLDEGWTPQGQAYAGNGELLTTYYRHDSFLTPWDDSRELAPWEGGGQRGVLLSIQDTTLGSERSVALLGPDENGPDAAYGPPTHGGGAATNGDFVYVADTDGIYVYSRAQIDSAAVNPETGRVEVQALNVIPHPTAPDGSDLVSNASFMAVHGDYAYVGGYSKDGDGKTGAVWRFEIDAEGNLVDPQGTIAAPDRAQGVTVANDGQGLLFSTGEQRLVYQPIESSQGTFAAAGDSTDVDNGKIDSWAQGISIVGDELWVTYENGSHQYDGEDGPQSIERIRLDELGDFPVGEQPS